MSFRPVELVYSLRDASEGAMENSLLYALNVLSLQGDYADQDMFRYCTGSTLQAGSSCDYEGERP